MTDPLAQVGTSLTQGVTLQQMIGMLRPPLIQFNKLVDPGQALVINSTASPHGRTTVLVSPEHRELVTQAVASGSIRAAFE
jgi:hypothetical protein